MKASELRQKYLDFFASKGHAVIPSASLLPENDPTCLFTTAGMHPLVPFLLGEKHPAGTKLTSVQKCIRTGDIEEVGDAVHLTFFEMLGNWSLGDYWKKEAIEMSFEFLTKELGFPVEKLAVSVFAGDDDQPSSREAGLRSAGAPFDEESFGIWKGLGIPEARIAKLSKKHNWWGPAGKTGPCGPDTEMFYWVGDGEAPENFQKTHEDPNWVEIWNDVFMEYEKKVKSPKSKVESEVEYEFVPLKQKNVDTGMGLDRVASILQEVPTVFETDLFIPTIEKVDELSVLRQAQDNNSLRSKRIIADHLRAATFIIGDERGVPPSNVDAGYVVRRLIRRAIREARKLGFDFSQTFTTQIAEVIIKNFGEAYPELVRNSEKVLLELEKEENQFKKTLNIGEREIIKIFERGEIIDGKKAFWLFETLGFPKEMIEEIITEKQEAIKRLYERSKTRELGEREAPGPSEEDYKKFNEESGMMFSSDALDKFHEEGVWDEKKWANWNKEFKGAQKAHSDKSRTASAGKFAGGLADDSEEVARLHTATHLLNAALRKVLGDHVQQKGSNITADRLRFDFSHPDKMTPEQLAEVEKLVNEAIEKDLPVTCEEMTVDEAKAAGAVGVFDAKYGEKVKVYTVGSSTGSESPFSREICGGPHAKRTGELGKFKIKKEESSSAGVRRIKGVLLTK